ncbi:MAG TPA: diguanylate cyclase [Steroidobacteraceae bacterium]|nr:diguanylate cyclase [Steroidobacteraceae bacterium]
MTEDFGDTTIIFSLKEAVAVAPKVLIVDDDPLICERLRGLVMAAGFEARTVSSGAAALASLRKNFSPIVISDRMMPDMDGLTLCRTIRSEKFIGYVYVLLLTVQDAEQDILAGLEAGADDYLSKRVSSAQLIARLRTAQRILTLEHSLRTVVDEKSRLATTDTLTGASNRRYFTRHFSRELKRVQRHGGALSLLMLDIDHFKQVNDRFGHAIGDEVLQEFARRITSGLPRESDWFARMGGEEFVVVLPQTSIEGAQVVAEKLRASVAAAPVRTLAGAVNMTVSIGVADLAALAAAKIEASTDAMLDLADRCLYESKANGRNRISVPRLAR